MSFFNKKIGLNHFLIFTLFFVLLVVPTVFVHAQPGGDPVGQVTLQNPLSGGVDTITEFVELLVNNIVLPIGSVVVVIVFIYAGFLFVTSQGNETKLATAKHTFWWAVIGTAILLGAWVIANVIQATVCQIAENTPGCSFVGPPAP